MLVPKLFTTLKGYRFQNFLSDLNAGAVVAVIAFPLAIALGIASGVAPGAALYTAIIGCFLVSLLGGSRVQIAGPTGAFVVIVYGIVQKYGISGLMLATMMGGLLMIFMGLIRLGSLIKFIPYPITTGFTAGIALVIFTTQLKDFFGLQLKQGEIFPAHFLQQWQFLLLHLKTVNLFAVGIALFSILLLLMWPRFVKKIPASLVVVVLTTTITLFLEKFLGRPPVDTIGSRFGSISLSVQLFDFHTLSLETVKNLFLPAMTIALLGSIESLLSAVVADGMIGGNHRSNMELIANGIANLTCGLTGGIPVTGAIARTAANVKNGGRTPVAGLLSALILLLLSLLLLPVIKLIPMASLAAILMVVAYNMGEWSYFVQFRKIPKSDYAVFLLTFFLTLFFDLIVGIFAGLMLASLLFMKRMANLSETINETDLLGQGKRDPQKEHDWLKQDKPLPEYDLPPSVSLYEIRGPFFFGAAEKFATTMRSFKQDHSIIILKMDRVPAMDATGLNAFLRFKNEMQRRGCKIVVAGLNPQPKKFIKKEGAVVLLCDTIEEAIESVEKLLESP